MVNDRISSGPPPAAQMASKAGYGPKSLITLRAATGEGGGSGVQGKATSDDGEPLMFKH